MEITAIIVARAGSVRVKNKSMLTLGNDTLISRKIKQLQQCKYINRIVFGSDSNEMLSHAQSFGVEVVKRESYYCDETKASANDMIKNMCELIQTDIIVWAHCTNPLLSSATYDNAIETFLNHTDIYNIQKSKYDSLLSVVAFQEHLWNEYKKPLNYNPYSLRHTPARALPMYYLQDGGIFIQPYKQMKENSYFFGKRPYLFSIPENEFLDINNYRDYIIALSLYNAMGGGNRCFSNHIISTLSFCNDDSPIYLSHTKAA